MSELVHDTPSVSDPVGGCLAMFASYIRCGDEWDDVAARALERANENLAIERRLLASAFDQKNSALRSLIEIANIVGEGEQANHAGIVEAVRQLAARASHPSPRSPNE